MALKSKHGGGMPDYRRQVRPRLRLAASFHRSLTGAYPIPPPHEPCFQHVLLYSLFVPWRAYIDRGAPNGNGNDAHGHGYGRAPNAPTTTHDRGCSPSSTRLAPHPQENRAQSTQSHRSAPSTRTSTTGSQPASGYGRAFRSAWASPSGTVGYAFVGSVETYAINWFRWVGEVLIEL